MAARSSGGPNAGARQDELDALYGDVGAGLGGDGEQNANNRASLEDAYQAYEPNQARRKEGSGPAPIAPAASSDNASVSVYVGNLQWWTTDVELENLCSECGSIKSLRFFEDKANGSSKGYALVAFTDRQGAEACLAKLNGREIDGKKCVVAFQHQKSTNQPAQANATPSTYGQSGGGPMHRQYQSGAGRGYSRPYGHRPYGGSYRGGGQGGYRGGRGR